MRFRPKKAAWRSHISLKGKAPIADPTSQQPKRNDMPVSLGVWERVMFRMMFNMAAWWLFAGVAIMSIFRGLDSLLIAAPLVG